MPTTPFRAAARAASLLAGLWAAAATPAARAEQFVLFDVTFTFSKADADTSKPSKSHVYVKGDRLNPNRPRDWTAPVDYRNGTVHIRAEVIEKPPGGEPTTWTLCYIPNKGRGNGYGCTGTGVYREKGVYERDVPMTSFWENDSIVWSEGIKQMDLVIKDNSGGGGHAHKRKDAEKFFPTKMRITMVQVSAGSTYDPSLVPNLPGGNRADGKTAAAPAERGDRLAPSTDWPGVGNDPGCMRYSVLDEIHTGNVSRLKPAWTYHTGELEGRPGKTIECTPVVVDGVMYLTTAYLRVVAVDAATGAERWRFDPLKDHPFKHQPTSGGVNRGCAYWSDGKPGGERRVLHGTSDGRLFSLNAKDGKLDPKFADGGILDLHLGLGPKAAGLGYGPTSAPAVWKDTVIVGVSCGEGPGIAAPGDVRAFDVRTGRDVWTFRTVPGPGEFGHETWEGDSWKDRGGANAWGGLSVDAGRGLVFAGLGSAAFDFYGGDRLGDNLFANCTVALDARTGKRVWHFQTLRHDLWDHDLPVYPNLVAVTRGGKRVDAVAQVTKTGYVFLFDRETGTPLFDVRDQPVPASDTPGERAAPTQPVPVKPPPFAAQSFDESNVTDIGPANRASVLARLKDLRRGPAFNPPSRQGTVVIPGFHGGATWSGASFDPTTGLLYVNANNVPNVLTLTDPRPGAAPGYGPYGHAGYVQFLDHEGYPAIKPPWGVLNAIDLNTGEFAWRTPLGEHPELTARGVPRTGTETFGGSIVTAGGLVFIAGTRDERIHAFDKRTGRLLWEHPLPAGGYATPSTYRANGRQYVVIAAGGSGKLGSKAGDAFVAFALDGGR